jgi:hypothetical protein
MLLVSPTEEVVVRFSNEPALWVAAIDAILLAFVAFGLEVTVEQLGAISIALAAVSGLLVRQNVTPVNSSSGEPYNDDYELVADA